MEGLDEELAQLFFPKFHDPVAFHPAVVRDWQDEVICLEVSCAILTIWWTRAAVWNVIDPFRGQVSLSSLVSKEFEELTVRLSSDEKTPKKAKMNVRKFIESSFLGHFWINWSIHRFITSNN